jgi:hypothetical protein
MTDYRRVFGARNRGKCRGCNRPGLTDRLRLHDHARLAAICPDLSYRTNLSSRSFAMHSQYEALARERMLEQRANAAHLRLTNELAAARRWRRLAAFAASRASRSQRLLAERSATDNSLAR